MSLRILFALVVGFVVAVPALAAPVFTVEFGTDPNNLGIWTPADLGEVENPDGTSTFTGTSPFGQGGLIATWDLTTDADPFVDGVFAITNNTLVTQTFIVSFLAPVFPPLAAASGGASVGGTLTVNGGGGTLGHNGTNAMFTAIVDNGDFATLLAHDSSVGAAFGTVFTAPDSFGLPGLTTPIPGGVSTNIGIRLEFTLTSGDSASFTSRFEVIEVVPEPTTGLLLGAGLVGLAIARRRA